jgi:hypothetical protein
MAECYDMGNGVATWSSADYDGATTYGIVQPGIDYDVGQSSGQFMLVAYSDTYANAVAFEENYPAEHAAMQVDWQQFFYTWLNWFGADAVMGGIVTGNVYTQADLIEAINIDQPEEASTVTFTSYPPKGWVGYCSTPNCEGQTPAGIVTGYEYNAQYYYFVFYATADAYDGLVEGTYEELSAEVKAWLESFFVWLVPAEPEAPSSDGVADILTGIGAASAPLTVTLLWNAPVDLDLYLYCPDGSEIGWSSGVGVYNTACDGKLDHDM